jgi:molybdopterin biosynthesis enzyme
MISISEALEITKKQIVKLSVETVNLDDSTSRILAETVRADMDLPPFDRSQMDGFAVRSKDVKEAPVQLKIVGEAVAGKGFEGRLNPGEAVRIMTGARVSGGADAVQKVELTTECDGYITIAEPTKLQQHIVKQAEEITKGEKIFSKGAKITERKIAVLASFGYSKIKVFRKPQVSVLATGSEIVGVNEKPQRDQIRNSNSMMLKILAESCGADAKILPSVKDDIEILKSQISEAVGLEFKVQGSRFKVQNDQSQIANRKSQILIITGGVSVGDYDFTKPALRDLGAEIFFERIALRPGKPMVFAKLNGCFIFGLPGNPVSAAVTFYLFVRRAILQMQAANDGELKEGCAVLSAKAKGAKERDSFLPAKLSTDDKAKLCAEPLRWSGSSDFVAFSKSDCLIFIPKDESYEPGEIVKIVYLP